MTPVHAPHRRQGMKTAEAEISRTERPKAGGASIRSISRKRTVASKRIRFSHANKAAVGHETKNVLGRVLVSPSFDVSARNMRTFLTTIVFLSFLTAMLSVSVLFTTPFQGSDVIVASVFTGLAALLYLGRHAYLIRFGRLGLLTPKMLWKPMTPDERSKALTVSSAFFVSTSMRNRSAAATNDIDGLVLDQMRRVKALGYDQTSRSDDELRSENKLLRFIDSGNEDRSVRPMAELRGVRRKDVFFDLRKKVDDWYAERAASNDAYHAWLAEVGNKGQSHLLKDGWISFLEHLPGPDIHLWHGVATDFNEMSRDRLAAAFWILDQEACDRATASDFIKMYIAYELEGALKTGRADEVRRFTEIVEAYNNGRYRTHSITAGAHADAQLDDQGAATALEELELRFGIPFPSRPRGLVDSETPTSHPADRGYRSPYDFWYDEGLHLRYPGPDWRAKNQPLQPVNK
jgi:hypothetical protein